MTEYILDDADQKTWSAHGRVLLCCVVFVLTGGLVPMRASAEEPKAAIEQVTSTDLAEKETTEAPETTEVPETTEASETAEASETTEASDNESTGKEGTAKNKEEKQSPSTEESGKEEEPFVADGLFDEERLLEPVVMTPEEAQAPRLSGAASELDAEEMQQFEYGDPHDIVTRVPGVYARAEDGFGLRPNIGLRGVDPDRSKKVTLMEDGILFGPAPYSAPAAYYFPMLQRMTGMEVYKGPATVRFGPQTISGVINFLSRPIPEQLNAGGSVSLGRFLTGTEHGYIGTSNEWGGILFEAVNSHSNGFKELDTGGPTGFSRSEFNLRGALHFESADARVLHDIDLGTSFSREISRETYLGLSTDDFRDRPYRRYVGSDLGRMQWWRTGAHVRYRLKVEDRWKFNLALYRHDFERTWFKFTRFADGTDAFVVLNNPNSGGNDFYYDALTGQADSATLNELMIGSNHRRFVSQGVQALTSHHYRSGDISNRAELGIRVHNDFVDRDHTEERYQVRSGELQRANTPVLQTTNNTGSTLALAFHVHDRFQWKDLQIAGGVRLEHMMMDFEIRPNDVGVTDTSSSSTTQTAILPGFGVDYEFADGFHGLVGVHRGFSAVAPGQDDSISPEYSVNYEFGGRYERTTTGTKFEVIGFYNDYSNILDICGFTCGGGLNQQTQFNGGDANVFGLELEAAHTFLANKGYDIPLRVSYTYTRATFASSFDSGNPRWGDVEKGDRIPYVPRHELSVEAGVSHQRWSSNIRLAFHDSVLEQAGTYDDENILKTDSYVMLDALVAVRLVHNLEAFIRGENLLNQQAIAARRPLGARPVKPLMVMGGFRWQLRENK